MPPTTPPPSAPSGDMQNPGGFTHIPALDGVRGLAILLILFFHLFDSNPETGSRFLNFVSHAIASFYFGVNLFFVLSGFLITGILLDTLHQPHFFKTFYIRRALRIFPLYYGVLVLLFLLTRPFHFIWSGWQYFYLTYTANLALWYTPHPLMLEPFNISHFWCHSRSRSSSTLSGLFSFTASGACGPHRSHLDCLYRHPSCSHRPGRPASTTLEHLPPLFANFFLCRQHSLRLRPLLSPAHLRAPASPRPRSSPVRHRCCHSRRCWPLLQRPRVADQFFHTYLWVHSYWRLLHGTCRDGLTPQIDDATPLRKQDPALLRQVQLRPIRIPLLS